MTYLSEVRKIETLINYWYEIASDQYSQGNAEGQMIAYQEIDKLNDRKNNLVNPEEEQLLTGNEKWFEI